MHSNGTIPQRRTARAAVDAPPCVVTAATLSSFVDASRLAACRDVLAGQGLGAAVVSTGQIVRAYGEGPQKVFFAL
jgi:hypothetical protein